MSTKMWNEKFDKDTAINDAKLFWVRTPFYGVHGTIFSCKNTVIKNIQTQWQLNLSQL